MSFKLSELLNPAPTGATSTSPAPAAPSSSSSPPSKATARPASSHATEDLSPSTAYRTPVSAVAETGFDLSRISASTARSRFAETGAADAFVKPYTETHEQNDLAAPATPVEPSPPVDRAQQPHSPTLDRYHHGSKSPESQRRQSLTTSPVLQKLPPIQSLSNMLCESVEDTPPQNDGSYGQSSATGHPAPQALQRAYHAAPDGLDPSHSPVSATIPPHSAISYGHSPAPKIKSEPSGTPREGTPALRANSTSNPSIDAETLKALNELKNEHGLRGAKRDRSTPAKETPQPLPKKRPPPKSTEKKGTATAVKKPPAKKRKVDTDSTGGGTPTSVTRRSATPSSRISKTPALGPGGRTRKSQSGTPITARSPAALDQEPQSEVDDDNGTSAEEGADVFCICRRPDNHKWMIACDGGCEDWFHGKCVKIREEDGDLIDKYICPVCESKGRGVTTWKPMCRRPGCRKPARLTKGKPSKYCSDACGLEFFQDALSTARQRETAANQKPKKKQPSRRKSARDRAHASDDDRDENDDDSVDLGPRGGVVRPKEIKALATSASDVASFRSLGDRAGIGVISPPATASSDLAAGPDLALNAAETARLASITDERAGLRVRRKLLRDRERFVAVLRENVASYAESEGVKVKDVCGFDARLAWNEQEFARWRLGKEGREVLGEPDGIVEDGAATSGEGVGTTERNTDDQMDTRQDGTDARHESKTAPTHNADGNDATGEGGGGGASSSMCTRKRCERHKQWQKLALQDVRFEEADVTGEMRRLDAEEKEIRERAMLRWREERSSEGPGGEVVEVVEAQREERANAEAVQEGMDGVEMGGHPKGLEGSADGHMEAIEQGGLAGGKAPQIGTVVMVDNV